MNPSIELIRIIAVLLITFTHTRNDLSEGWGYFIVERLPTFGTAILSIVSGYLYFTISRKKSGLLAKKVRSLAIPYLFANGFVLVLVLAVYWLFDYQALNRLSYDFSLFSEGLLSLNQVPINPPTYFIRDIFVVFVVLELFTNRNPWTLLILLPLLVFGKLFIQINVVILFAVGCGYAYLKPRVQPGWIWLLSGILVIISAVWLPEYLRFSVPLLLFVWLVHLPIRFFNVGRYTYLLHLYHSPIMVVSYPALQYFFGAGSWESLVLQIVLALSLVYVLFLATKQWPILRVLSGGR